jgi:uncharacterized membrane protein
MRLSTRAILLVAIVLSIFSYAKFEHCEKIGWSQPGTDVHQCYTDISALFVERGFDQGTWAYSSDENAVEYPVLQGTIMWATAKIAAGDIFTYYRVNIALIALLFIGSALILNRIKPEVSYLYLAAPPMVLAMFINWDMWAIITMLLAIYLFDSKRESWSAVVLAISIATKFFPIVLLIAVAIIYTRRREFAGLARYLAIALGGYIAINLPYALTTPRGWWRFFDMNLHRQPDWGSLWLGFEIFKYHITGFNVISLLAVVIPVLIATLFLISRDKTISLAESSFFFIAIVMTFGKVYSPQYVLWLVPLAVIALVQSKESLGKTLPIFWFWIVTEVIYQLSIWIYLAGHGTQHHLIPRTVYGLTIFIRIIGIVAMLISLARQHRQGRILDLQRWPELPV